MTPDIMMIIEILEKGSAILARLLKGEPVSKEEIAACFDAKAKMLARVDAAQGKDT
jgi:hypothetical protein